MIKNIIVFFLLLNSVAICAKPFVFTAIPDADETRLTARFNKVAQYLQQQLGTEVKYLPVKSYSAAVSAFRNNQVQLAWFGGLTGVQARRLTPGAKAIAQGEEDQHFKTYFIAHNSTGLKPSSSLNDTIKGMTFTFGSKSSTSGRLMPDYYLREHFKHPPEHIFSRVGFSGNHSRTIALVQSGSYQLGALNYQVWEKELAQGKVDTSKVSVIWQTPNYTDYQWSVRGDIEKHWGTGFEKKLTHAILNMKEPELLKTFPRKRFVPADNTLYEAIEKTAQSIGLLD